MSIQNIRTSLKDFFLYAPKSSRNFIYSDGVDLDFRDEACELLHSRGGCKLGSLINSEQAGLIRDKIDSIFNGEIKNIRFRWIESAGIGKVLSPLRVDPVIFEAAFNPLAIAIIEKYFMRAPYLGDIDMRILPPRRMSDFDKARQENRIGYSANNWHRDNRGRQVKLMIYLSDVAENDNNFSYCPATHGGYHKQNRPLNQTRIDDQIIQQSEHEIVEWDGKAGDAMLFDTNLIHRIKRRDNGIQRYSVTFYYTPGQELRELDYDNSNIESLEQKYSELLKGRRIIDQTKQ